MENISKKQSIKDVIQKYKEELNKGEGGDNNSNNDLQTPPQTIPESETTQHHYNPPKEDVETDPDLMTSYETISLPSQGLFYANKMNEIAVEYLTTRDEDLLTTPSLIENGTVIDKLLKRKIKTPNVNVESLMPGDKSAIILFLRTSAYGPEYTVEVEDPRNGKPFKEVVDLYKLEHKKINEHPDENGLFDFLLPLRRKKIKFKLLNSREEKEAKKTAEHIQHEYKTEFPEYTPIKLKMSVVEIDGKTDKTYISKFIDAMPLGDSIALKRKMNEVSPEFDMKYTFTASDGYKFDAYLMVGPDFFFPNQ